MTNYNDFDLDVRNVGEVSGEDDKISSKFACTPGCVTGPLHCLTKNCITNTCPISVDINISKN